MRAGPSSDLFSRSVDLARGRAGSGWGRGVEVVVRACGVGARHAAEKEETDTEGSNPGGILRK